MFERFTDDARRVVVLAQEQSRVLCHDFIGPEHLLLALAADPDTIAGRVLVVQGVTFKRAREVVVAHHGTGDTIPSADIPFTPHAKAVLERALRVCDDLGGHEINPGHLLMGLLLVEDAIAQDVLRELNIAVADTIERAEVLLEQHAPPAAAPPEKSGGRATRWTTSTSDETVPGPRCASCRSGFPAHLRRANVTFEAPESGEVTLLWCAGCGATLGAVGS